MLQLTIKTDLDALPAAIEANFPEIKAALGEMLKRYDGLLVETDKAAIAAAKADCADLNRLALMLDETRKRVKAKCLKPYADFEARVKELTGMIADARAPIDRQIRAYDKARREQVAAALSDYYAAEYHDLAALVPFARIFDQRWTNATVSEQSAHGAIDAKAQEIRDALGALSDTAPAEWLKEAANRYAETLDLAGTLAWLKERRERDEALAAAVAQPAAAAAATVQTPPRDAPAVVEATVEMAEADAAEAARLNAAEAAATAPADDPEMTYTLRFTGRRSKLFAMAAWMRANGITYTKIN